MGTSESCQMRCDVVAKHGWCSGGQGVTFFLCRMSLLSASERFLLSVVSILTRSHTDSKASGLLCPRVLTALQMAP